MDNINKDIEAYKFSETAREKPYFKEGIREFLKNKLYDPFSFGFQNLTDRGIYKIHGWVFDFRPLLKKFVYKSSVYGLQEGFFINKGNLRKVIRGRIYYIREIPKE